MIENILINGLIHGGVYALLAVGFSLIFGVARIVNIAHTAFYMIAAYLIYTFSTRFGLNPLLAIPLSIVIVFVIGLLVYQLTIRPIQEHEVTVLIVTIAIAMVFQEVMLLIYGGHFRGNPSLLAGYVEILRVRVSYQHLLTLIVVFFVLMATWWILLKTRLGIAIRATAQDREVANLMGMNVNQVAMITMGIAVTMAAIAGVLVAPLSVVEPYMWLHPLVMMLAIVVLGGLGSIKGSLAGAFILGFAETLVVFLIPLGAFLKGAFSLTIMLVVLLIRPEGLFGVVFEEER
jgi:branched-chain amino acid transport system permease protein